jgi:hypothetical protein
MLSLTRTENSNSTQSAYTHLSLLCWGKSKNVRLEDGLGEFKLTDSHGLTEQIHNRPRPVAHQTLSAFHSVTGNPDDFLTVHMPCQQAIRK